jgi:hypothetical protein
MYRWRPLETARNRSAPMACGPNVDQARPLAGAAALRVADLGWQGDPRRLPPDKRAPPGAIALLGGALAGSGPGTSPYIDGLSLVTGMVVPQHAACSNHADDGGCLDDMTPRGRSVLVSRSWCAAAGEVGFEPAVSLHHSPRSGPGRCGDLRFPRTGRDRSCPTGTAASRCCADPARTTATSTRLGPVPSGRGRLRRSGPPRPGTGSAGPGTARSITASTLSLPFVLVPFDRGSGAGQSDVSHRE